MKMIKSILGDVWHISENDAMPDGGDRRFGLNENMVEMIDKSQVSEKWAKRLRIIAEAPLNTTKDAIYVPDKTFFNWFRVVSLENPEFRQDDYFSGALVYYPEDTRLFVEEFVAEPGSYYGPYYICARIDGALAGMVGYTENRSDLPAMLEKLSGTELHPLPKFSTEHSTVFELCAGFRAEVYVSETQVSDIVDADFVTIIADADNRIVFEGVLSPAELFALKESHDELQGVLDSYTKMRSEYHEKSLSEANEQLRKFHALEVYLPESASALTERITNLPHDAPLKLLSADGQTELLVSSEIIKEWRSVSGQAVEIPKIPTKSDIKGLGLDAVRLIHRREFHVAVKDASGFEISNLTVRHGFSIDKLFGIVADKEGLRKGIDEIQSWYRVQSASILERKAILSMVDSDRDSEIKYVFDRVIPIEALIKRARPDTNSDHESPGMSMG